MAFTYFISIHACHRYLQRVIGAEAPENQGLGTETTQWVRRLIKDELAQHEHNISVLGDGQYIVNDFVYVIRDGILRTVKASDTESAKRYSGGILASGKKLKKLRAKRSQNQRLKTEITFHESLRLPAV